MAIISILKVKVKVKARLRARARDMVVSMDKEDTIKLMVLYLYTSPIISLCTNSYKANSNMLSTSSLNPRANRRLSNKRNNLKLFLPLPNEATKAPLLALLPPV